MRQIRIRVRKGGKGRKGILPVEANSLMAWRRCSNSANSAWRRCSSRREQYRPPARQRESRAKQGLTRRRCLQSVEALIDRGAGARAPAQSGARFSAAGARPQPRRAEAPRLRVRLKPMLLSQMED